MDTRSTSLPDPCKWSRASAIQVSHLSYTYQPLKRFDRLSKLCRCLAKLETYNRKSCKRCCDKLSSKRLVKAGTKVLKHPLPRDGVDMKAVLSKLRVPEAFAAFHDVAWSILNTLGHPEHVQGRSPEMSLKAYTSLKRYRTSAKCRISLASTTKSFLIAHYSKVKLPASLSEVCVPLRLKFSYFDTTSNL